MNKKTNLFVVGAMKAGTTSFNEMLAQHPEVYFSPVKEPHFFVKDLPKSMYSPSQFFDLDKYLKNDFPDALHIAHLQTQAQYEKIFSLAPNQVKYRAEGSTGYLHAPESAELIHQYNPEAKIIILVRDPLKRAYSHYQMNAGLGRETRSFEEAISQEIQNFQQNKKDAWSYLGMSLYTDNVEKYLNLFGASQVLVMNLSDYKKNTESFLNQVFSFLNIQPHPLMLENKNVSRTIKNKSMQQFIYQSGLRDVAAKLLPQSLRQRIFRSLSSEKVEMQLSSETEKQWHEIIQSQNLMYI